MNTDEADRLLAYLPVLSELAADFEPRWLAPVSGEPAVTHMMYPDYPASVEEFFQIAAQDCWSDREYDPVLLDNVIRDDAAIASATFEQIRALLTYCVRGERFCDGHWGAMIREGRVVAILRRLQQLRESAGR